jgi:uncharacterized protein YacL
VQSDAKVSRGESLNAMSGTKQGLLLIGSIVALIVATLAAYFVFADPGILSVLLFVTVVPVFTALGIGLFMIARDEFLKSKIVARRRPKETKEAAN